jgi:large subunit ribosomal protein L10
MVKDRLMSELRSRYATVESALWVEIVGADGILTNDFRRDLRKKKMRLEVVRNLLFRRVAASTKLEPLGQALSGPAALITGGESLTDVAKAVEEWSPKIKGLRMRGAVFEGEFIDEKGCATISKMPTKRDLQGRVAAAIRSPGANLAAAILASGGRIAGCLKALIEKLEAGGSAAPAAAEPTGAEPAAAQPAAAEPAAGSEAAPAS